MKSRSKLPKSLLRYFWDVEPNELDLKKHSVYVISRLFEHGNMEALDWTLKSFSKPSLRAALSRRELSPRSRHFFALLLDSKLHTKLCTRKSSTKKCAQRSNIWEKRKS